MSKAKSLAELRENNDKSQADVAKILGITPQGYGLIERGERGLKVEAAAKLADFFGVNVEEIILLALQNNNKLLQATGTD